MRYKTFVKLCKKTQPELKTYVTERLREAGYDPIVGDGYVYARGEQVLLTAHLDTVHKQKVKDVWINGDMITSPQGIGGDDRCGVFIILRIIKETTYRPSVLFCEDEEIGGVGSDKFAKTEMIHELSTLKYLVEIDRHGNEDAVFYSCDNPEFTKYITETTGYKTAWGTFSDIGNLSPACGIASVNLSSGYYSEHTEKETVNYAEMMHTKDVVVKLLKDAKNVKSFEYIEEEFDWDSYSYNRSYGVGTGTVQVWIMWDDNGQEFEDFYTGLNMYDAFGQFFFDHPTVSCYNVLDYDIYAV